MLINSGGLTSLFIVMFLVLALGIGQVVWIYLDSRNRGDKLKVLWAMLAITPLLVPIILPLPIIVYLLVTRAFSEKCSNCKTRVVSSFSSCPTCGSKLKEKCRICHKALKEEWNYCPYCSDKIKKESLDNENN
ncbi:zinc ribbon domain-containing protein [Romboutsia weinsteinii]|uniref:Zinc ribbon domain-containing protein n=1 Tax=Romboutsia weinsteinii TaxID=2020949 RepID=A0A371IYB4_9FIRM|nr:zinc ribbon domain-containing protein [Romboutsia weinsteinii]RDY25477.1 zinc ribbon domain-containing protein [Romboutsia weinsteinii]